MLLHSMIMRPRSILHLTRPMCRLPCNKFSLIWITIFHQHNWLIIKNICLIWDYLITLEIILAIRLLQIWWIYMVWNWQHWYWVILSDLNFCLVCTNLRVDVYGGGFFYYVQVILLVLDCRLCWVWTLLGGGQVVLFTYLN